MAAKLKKRYVHYSVPGGKKTLEAWLQGDLLAEVNKAFRNGETKPGKSADTLEELTSSTLVLDTKTGNLCVQAEGQGAKWLRPHWDCPDCSGQLELRKKYFRIGSPSSPWMYQCSHKEAGCDTVMPANAGGNSAPPVDKSTREARKITTDMFGRLWKETPDVLDWAGDPDEMPKFLNAAKARAYRFLAEKMIAANGQETEKSIGKMDIETLRVAYKICRDADLAEVVKVPLTSAQ